MKQSKHDVYQYIMDITRPLSLINNIHELEEYVYKTYSIPRSLILDIVSNRVEETEAISSDFVMYGIVDGIAHTVSNDKVQLVEDIFDSEEIQQLSTMQFEEKKLDFPLIIDAIRVDDDFFVGGADVNWFMLLRDAGKIKYNKEIQRMLRVVVKNGQQFFEPATNKKAITGIMRLFQERLYIPNAITLNISDDSKPDYYYDSDNKELIIKSIDHFDILDGYNRYYGMTQEKILDPNFNTNFVLQITNFSYAKGKQYIHQQDLKIKMKKEDAASMNIAADQNQICERLNSDPLCNWSGKILRNGGDIPFQILASVIWRYYFSGNLKSVGRGEIVRLTTEIRDKINTITEMLPQYLDETLDLPTLSIIMYVVRYGMDDSEKERGMISKIPNTIAKLTQPEYKINWLSTTEYLLKPKTVKLIQETIEG